MCWSTVAEVWWATVKFNQRSVNNQQFSVWKEATCSRVVAIFHLLVLHLLRHQAYKFIPHKSRAFARIMLDFIFRYMYFICYLSSFDSASSTKVRFCSISSFSRWSLARPRPVNVNTVATLTSVLTKFVQQSLMFHNEDTKINIWQLQFHKIQKRRGKSLHRRTIQGALRHILRWRSPGSLWPFVIGPQGIVQLVKRVKVSVLASHCPQRCQQCSTDKWPDKPADCNPVFKRSQVIRQASPPLFLLSDLPLSWHSGAGVVYSKPPEVKCSLLMLTSDLALLCPTF